MTEQVASVKRGVPDAIPLLALITNGHSRVRVRTKEHKGIIHAPPKNLS